MIGKEDNKEMAMHLSNRVFLEIQEKVEGTNINPVTLLATDYLNHFNEIVMLFEMLPEMPEMLEECKQWKPVTYKEHFSKHGMSESELAVTAYDYVPDLYRQTFEMAVDKINALIFLFIEEMEQEIQNSKPDVIKEKAMEASIYIQKQMDIISAIIHGSEEVMKQVQIDRYMGDG